MLKRILLINRKIVRYSTPYMYALGTAFAVIIGASILAGGVPDVDIKKFPDWQGHLYLWVGFLSLLSYGVDLVFRIIHKFVGMPKRETLSQKIIRAEQSK